MKIKINKKKKKPKLGLQVALVSQKNRVFKDKKKEEKRLKCRSRDVNYE